MNKIHFVPLFSGVINFSVPADPRNMWMHKVLKDTRTVEVPTYTHHMESCPATIKPGFKSASDARCLEKRTHTGTSSERRAKTSGGPGLDFMAQFRSDMKAIIADYQKRLPKTWVTETAKSEIQVGSRSVKPATLQKAERLPLPLPMILQRGAQADAGSLSPIFTPPTPGACTCPNHGHGISKQIISVCRACNGTGVAPDLSEKGRVWKDGKMIGRRKQRCVSCAGSGVWLIDDRMISNLVTTNTFLLTERQRVFPLAPPQLLEVLKTELQWIRNNNLEMPETCEEINFIANEVANFNGLHSFQKKVFPHIEDLRAQLKNLENNQAKGW